MENESPCKMKLGWNGNQLLLPHSDIKTNKLKKIGVNTYSIKYAKIWDVMRNMEDL